MSAALQMGIIEESEDVLDPRHLGHVVGPSVHLYTHDVPQDIWYGSVLLAVQSQTLSGGATTLTFTCGGGPAADVPSETLHVQRYFNTEWTIMRCAHFQHDHTSTQHISTWALAHAEQAQSNVQSTFALHFSTCVHAGFLSVSSCSRRQ